LYYSQRTGVVSRTYLHENHPRVSCHRFLEYDVHKGCVWAVVINYLLRQRDSSVSNFCLLFKVKICKVGTDFYQFIYILNSPSCNNTTSSLQWLLVSASIQSTNYLESKKKINNPLKPFKNETFLCYI